jgi:hypothetical protein
LGWVVGWLGRLINEQYVDFISKICFKV